MADNFASWLNTELEARGWSLRELSRRSGMSTTVISDVINERQTPGLQFCVQVGRAFQESPESILRRAGLLPSLPSEVEEEREVVSILRRLPETARRTVVTMLRALVGQQPAIPAVGEPRETYRTDDTLIPELLDEFARVPDEWKEEALRQIQFMNRMANRPARRLIGEDQVLEEERSE